MPPDVTDGAGRTDPRRQRLRRARGRRFETCRAHHTRPARLTEGHGAMRKLVYGMNLSLDGFVAAPGDDLGWSMRSDELFQWLLDQERAIGLLLYWRKLWETMSSHWPTGDQQPGAPPAQVEFARN